MKKLDATAILEATEEQQSTTIGDDTPKVVWGRPEQWIDANTVQFWKMLVVPDEDIRTPYLDYVFHDIYPDKTPCWGQECKDDEHLPCGASMGIYIDQKPHRGRAESGMMPADELADFNRRREVAKKLMAQRNHAYYVLDCTPICNKDGTFKEEIKKCFGERPDRPVEDAECAKCPMEQQCREAPTIYFAPFPVDPTRSKGLSRGSKLASVYSVSEKRVEQIFNQIPDKKTKLVETKLIRAEKTVKGEDKKTGTDYKFSLADDFCHIPAEAMKVLIDRMIPMKEAVLDKIDKTQDEVRVLVKKRLKRSVSSSDDSFDFGQPEERVESVSEVQTTVAPVAQEDKPPCFGDPEYIDPQLIDNPKTKQFDTELCQGCHTEHPEIPPACAAEVAKKVS